jgi:N-acetylmuramoyl-L-alanine amidase
MKRGTELYKRIIIIISAAIIIVFALVYSPYIINPSPDSLPTLSKYGSYSEEVRQIQTKLAAWGYYNGSIDGDYGYLTYNAVRLFQEKNGLVVDGIAGPQTLAALGIASGNNSANKNNTTHENSNVDSGDVQLLARLIHGEARGEPYEGKVAVGAVVLNRAADPRFPKTISGVIYQPGAFDAVSDGQINLEPDSSSLSAARDAMNGWDPTYGCVYYYNPSTATSSWIWSRPIVVVIGNHNFAK